MPVLCSRHALRVHVSAALFVSSLMIAGTAHAQNSGLFGQRIRPSALSEQSASTIGTAGEERGFQSDRDGMGQSENDAYSSDSAVSNDPFGGKRLDWFTGENPSEAAADLPGGVGRPSGVSRGVRRGPTIVPQLTERGAGGADRIRPSNQAQYVTRFPAPEVSAEALHEATADREQSIRQSLAQAEGIAAEVVLDGDIVILLGTAQTTYDRRLAERLILLEPGIRAVQNELQVPLD